MQGDDRRRRRYPELGAQQPAQPLVDHQRLGDVAAGGMDLHQHRVRALAKRLALDQPLRPARRVLQLRSAELEARSDHHAHQPSRQVAEVTTPLCTHVCESSGSSGAAISSSARAACAGRRRDRPVPAARGRRRAVLGHLDVDPAVVVELEHELPASAQRIGSEHASQPRQDRVQRGLRGARRLLGPQHRGELVAADRTLVIEHEIGEHFAPLAAGELSFDPVPARSTVRPPHRAIRSGLTTSNCNERLQPGRIRSAMSGGHRAACPDQDPGGSA